MRIHQFLECQTIKKSGKLKALQGRNLLGRGAALPYLPTLNRQ